MRQNTHLTHTQYIGLNISLMYGHHNKTGTVFVALDWSEVDVVKKTQTQQHHPSSDAFL